jgi:hypothetical protein
MTERFHPLQDTDEIRKERPLSNVNPQSDVGDFAILLIAEFHKGREESGGKIIDAEISGILKCFEGIGLSRTRQPADNDEIQSSHGGGIVSVGIPDTPFGSSSSAPSPFINCIHSESLRRISYVEGWNN